MGVYFRLKPRRKTKKTKARVPNCAINWLSFELHFTSKISALDYQKITRKHNKLHKYTCLLCFLTSHDFLDGFLCHKVIKTPSKRQNSFPTTAITQNARRRRNFKDFTSLRARSVIGWNPRRAGNSTNHSTIWVCWNNKYIDDQMRKSPYSKSKSSILR